MYLCNCSNSLNFNDDATANDDVRPVATIQFCPFIDHGNWLLPVELNAAELQLMTEAFLIYGLEESWTKLFVDGDRRSDNFVGELFVSHKKSLTQRRRVRRETPRKN
jgi:hypothetical protein